MGVTAGYCRIEINSTINTRQKSSEITTVDDVLYLICNDVCTIITVCVQCTTEEMFSSRRFIKLSSKLAQTTA